MASNTSLTIHPRELEDVMHLLYKEKVTRVPVKIVDAGDRFVVRDQGEFKIGEVIKKDDVELVD